METSLSAPSNGSAVINADNTITYTSSADFAGGVITFAYTINDGNGGSDTATVGVNVDAVINTVDLDIASLRTPNRVRGGEAVAISLSVRVASTTTGQRPATIVGVANGTEVYRQTLLVTDAVGGRATRFNYPSYTTTGNEGVITWTATLSDDDPDPDQVTTTTSVR